MSLYRVDMADSVQSVRARIRDPRDRSRDVASLIEQLGGTFHDAWVTLDDFDTVMIVELPNDVAANALWSVVKANDAVTQVRVQNIISVEQHVEGLKQALAVDYTPPQGSTWDKNAPGAIAEFERVEPSELANGSDYMVCVADCNPESIRAMMRAPHDRTPAVASAIHQLGGQFRKAWITLTEYDACMIVSLPDDIAANALWSVLKAGEGVVKVHIQSIVSLDDHVEALRRAAQVKYTPPQGATWEK
ncbi:GYD domain-containing protein [Streptomyces sp. NPDC088789]|uniref:GYD domain-containing protein n=1 Tax=Streptomyces sp. NPDC088789 TaxID=3365899 RepID=UPI00382B2237